MTHTSRHRVHQVAYTGASSQVICNKLYSRACSSQDDVRPLCRSCLAIYLNVQTYKLVNSDHYCTARQNSISPSIADERHGDGHSDFHYKRNCSPSICKRSALAYACVTQRQVRLAARQTDRQAARDVI
jgi:hypothetical protein